MANVPDYKNPITVLRRFRSELEDRAGITSFDRDSKARSLMDIFTDEMGSLRRETQEAIRNNDPTSATGEALERQALARGVPLRPATFATVSDIEQNLAFFVESGTFGSINDGNDIPLTVGTVISSSPNNNERGAVVQYELLENVTLDVDSAIRFVKARALTRGSKGNVGAGVLRTHNFTNYTDSANASLQVVNFFSILTGRDAEPDRLLRFRMARNYDRLVQESDARLQLQALGVPGVRDVRVIPGQFGIGTAGVVLLGVDQESTQSLVESVQVKLDNIKGAALAPVATAATQVAMDFELVFRTNKTLNTADRTRTKNEVRTAIRNYLRSLGLGGVVVMEELIAQIQSRTSRVAQLGTIGKKGLIQNVYLRRGFSNGRLSERAKLIQSSVSLEQDEYAELGNLEIEFTS